MCRDQNLISETDGRTDGRASERMKIEKRGVGRPLLGPANTKKYQNVDNNNQKYPKLHKTSINSQKVQNNCKTIQNKKNIYPKSSPNFQKYTK